MFATDRAVLHSFAVEIKKRLGPVRHTIQFEKPQMWEQAHVGFGGRGRKRKRPCTKQCASRWKHGSCDTRLAEARPPKLGNTVKYRVEEMHPKWPFWKHRAPKMRLVEAQCAHRKHCYPETSLGSHPTSRVSQPVGIPENNRCGTIMA